MTKPGRLLLLLAKARAITSVQGLAAAGLVGHEVVAELQQVEKVFSIRLTPEVLGRISANSRQDPVFRQYVPSTDELRVSPAEMADPTGDQVHEKVKGLIHRYPDRVLLKPTHVCQVYCRFCFRREKVGQGEVMSAAELDAAYAYVNARPEIFEVILSGGDPLVLSDRRLAEMMTRLSAIAHIGVIRIHTRVPLVEPSRITPAFLKALKTRPQVFMVLHVNHAQELSNAVGKGLTRLRKAGIPLLSQSVLLRGVNDNAETLSALFRGLLLLGVKPYYLHHPDLAKGTAHFRVSLAEGQEIMRQLRGRISGTALPTYVLDIPGGFGKVPVGPNYVGQNEIADPWGRRHEYSES